MLCIRCKMAVQAVLEANGIIYTSIELGRVQLNGALNSEQREGLEAGLKYFALELMEDKTKILVERIKTEITNLLHAHQPMQLKLSAHLSQYLDHNYNYLSNVFSEIEGITLERYYITQRVERVKELIVYENLSVTQIMYELNYSSVSHLSLQFKKVTGMTPASFRKCLGAENFIWRAL